MSWKIIGVISSLIIGLIVMLFFNGIIESTLISDPCAYHNRETTVIFDIFYKMPAAEGYHPVPTLFNLTVTLSLGVVLAYWIYKLGKIFFVNQVK